MKIDRQSVTVPRYAELHCVSNFSFLQGGSHPEELVARAAALGYEAIALTDRATLSGMVRAHGAAKEAGIRLVIGAQLEPIDAAPIVVWAADAAGYANLCQLLTHGYAQAAERADQPAAQHPDDECLLLPQAGSCRLAVADISRFANGLLAGVPLTGCGYRETAGAFDGFRLSAAAAELGRLKDIFGDRLWGLAEVALEGDDAERLAWFDRVSRRAAVPVAAAGDVRYH